MMYSKIVTIYALIFFATIWFAQSLLEIPRLYQICLVGVSVVLIPRMRYVGIMCLTIIVALTVYSSHLQRYTFLEALEGEYQGTGVIVSEVLEKEGWYQFRARLNEGYLLVKTRNEEVLYGDTITVRCSIQRPESFDGFDYPKYLMMKRVHGACKDPFVQKISHGHGVAIYYNLLQVKKRVMLLFAEKLPLPHAPFMAGLIVGGTNGFPSDVLQDFQRTGASHIVAVSGSNVAIVISLCLALLTACSIRRKYRFYLITLGLLAFTMITGFQSSIVRAVFMGWLVVLAQSVGRVPNTRNSIIFAGMLLVMINPLVLRYDVGFQLSFAATIGLVYGMKVTEEFQRYLGVFAQYVLPTIIAYLWTLPITLLSFGTLSVIAPAVNILIAPLLPFGMLAGALIIGLGWIPGIEWGATFFGWLVLEVLLRIVRWGGAFSWAQVEVQGWWVYLVSLSIYILHSALWYFHLRKKRKSLESRLSLCA